MNYTRNQIARSLITKKSDTIAVIIPDISNLFYATLVKSIYKKASENGYSIMLCDTNNDILKEIEEINLLDNRLIDGILLASRNSEKVLQQYDNLRDLPIVIIDELKEIPNKNVFTVASDYELAGYNMTNYLIKNGHTKFFCLTGYEESINSKIREVGILRSSSEHGIDQSNIKFVEADYKFKKASDIIKNQKDMDYTAVIAFNDLMAYGAISAFESKGILVPQDISVVAFDTNASQSLFNDLSKYRLTSINQNEEYIGDLSVKIVLKVLEGGTISKKIHMLEADWLIGNTVRMIG